MGFRLESISIQGFRGYGKKARHIDLSAPVILFAGDNRSGKSSTLNAIEWVLYGEEVIKKGMGISERKDWLTQNRFSDATRVELRLKSDEGELVIEREIPRGRKRSSKFQFTDESGAICEEESALHQRLGLQAKGFMNSAYLHQEVLRDILVTTPEVRKEALDRLLGVTDLRDIAEGLKQLRASTFENEIAALYERLEGAIESESSRHVREKTDAQAKAEEFGLQQDSLDPEGFRKYCESAVALLQELKRSAGLELLCIERPESHADLRAFDIAMRRELGELRTSNPGAVAQGALYEKQGSLNDLRPKLETVDGRIKNARNEIASIESAHGKADQIQGKLLSLEGEIQSARDAMIELDARMSVVDEAKRYLEALPAADDGTPCPVCETPVVPDTLLAKLEQLGSDKADERDKLAGVVSDGKEQENELGKKASRLEELQNKLLPGASEERKRLIGEITTVLGVDVKEDQDPFVLIDKELEDIADKIEKNSEVLKHYVAGIENVERELEAAAIVRDFLQASERIEQVRLVTESDEWRQMNKQRTEVFRELEALEKVSGVVDAVLREARGSKLGEAGGPIADYFRRLVDRPDCEAIEISVEDSEVCALVEGETVNVVSFFNQGDMNCAALSIFLALGAGDGEGRNISFLMLDDPSQSLDAGQKEKLAKLLGEVAERSQVVLATMDEKLLDDCGRCISKAKRTYRFGEWTPEGGPSIEEL